MDIVWVSWLGGGGGLSFVAIIFTDQLHGPGGESSNDFFNI